jgi:hypothetical protein
MSYFTVSLILGLQGAYEYIRLQYSLAYYFASPYTCNLGPACEALVQPDIMF